MQYEIVNRKKRKRKRKNKKVIVLILSVFVAIFVVGIGLFGGSKVNKNRQAKDSQKKLAQDINKATDANGEPGGSNGDAQDPGGEQETTRPVTDDGQQTQTNRQLTSDGQQETTQPASDGQQQETTANAGESNPVSTEIDPTKPMVALTFDDGPSDANTGRLLDALKANGAHATFFVVGYNVDGNEAIIQRAAAEGNEIGNHTLNHSKLTSVDDAGLDSEIGGMRQRIIDLTGQSTVVIRPPYGAVDDRVMAHIIDPVILWSIDTEDWKTRNADATIQNIQQNVYDGAIILMHDIHAESVDAAVQIIPWLKEQGYQMVTMSELGYYRRGGLQTGIRYGALPPE